MMCTVIPPRDALRWSRRKRKISLKSETEEVWKIVRSLVMISLGILSSIDKRTMAVRRRETEVETLFSEISFKDIVVTRRS